ncbi:hypothetical protein K440DRAFT_643867 [Wilcoxina mikolae CBS 423.85]|nr:hypothetical protein K440DRAFT_643867 [Wilcoxina mikolae CBS 423.85]
MDIASFAFSVPSLTSLFNLCLQGYTTVRTAKSLGKDATTLLCQLEIEEARFITWGRGVDFLGTNEVNIPQAVVQVLIQISEIMSDTKLLRERYDIIVEDQRPSRNVTASTGTANAEYIAGLQRMRERLIGEYTRQSRLAASVQRGTSFLRKVRWVFTDKETLTTLISTLRGHNDSLMSMLNATSSRQAHQDFLALCLESSKTNDLLRLQIIEGAAKDRYKQMALPASHKVLRLKLELEYAERFENSNSELCPDNTEIASLQIPRQKVYIEHLEAPRSLGLYQSKQRLQLLSKLLHQDTPRPLEFRALGCFGFLLEESPARFAFVFNLPSPQPSSPRNGTPESLHDVISDDSSNRFRPSQTSRLILAKRLATSLLYLHSTGWLHKGVRSQNVLVLGDGDRRSPSGISKLIEEPPSNASGTEPVDNDPVNAQYRHPDVIGEQRLRFQKKYDVYSLGVMLIEIAYWKPLRKLVSSRRTAAENSKRLLDLVRSGDLAHWMGCIYSEAVKACLDCEWTSEDMELELFERVVKPLEQCVV